LLDSYIIPAALILISSNQVSHQHAILHSKLSVSRKSTKSKLETYMH